MTPQWKEYESAARKAMKQGSLAEAEALWLLAYKESTKFGQRDARFAVSVDNLANVRFLMGRYSQAEPLYTLAVAIREEVLGSEHKDLAVSINNLAALYYKQLRFKEAEALYARALSMRRNQFGPDHPEVAKSLYYLGLVNHAQKRYRQAEPFYRQALEMRNRVEGPNAHALAPVLISYAKLLRITNRREVAEQMEVYAKSLLN